MSFICILIQMNLIKAHGGKGSGPFSFERSATSPPQADHVLVDLFFIHGILGRYVKAPQQRINFDFLACREVVFPWYSKNIPGQSSLRGNGREFLSLHPQVILSHPCIDNSTLLYLERVPFLWSWLFSYFFLLFSWLLYRFILFREKILKFLKSMLEQRFQSMISRTAHQHQLGTF